MGLLPLFGVDGGQEETPATCNPREATKLDCLRNEANQPKAEKVILL